MTFSKVICILGALSSVAAFVPSRSSRSSTTVLAMAERSKSVPFLLKPAKVSTNFTICFELAQYV